MCDGLCDGLCDKLVRVIALVLAFVVLPSSAAPTEWGPIDLKSATVAPGTKLKFKFFAQQFFESGFLDTPLWAARGVKPGPTLCVISGIHGDEINSVEIARRSFQAVMPTRLAGTLIVVPEVNSLGFRNMNRYMIDRRDLNRAFPGTMRGSVTSQAARANGNVIHLGRRRLPGLGFVGFRGDIL